MGNSTRNISDVMSRKIAHLMFIMSVMVVFIHFTDFTYINMGEYKMEQTVEYVMSQCFGRIAVPLFFCFSGYLTFSKIHVSSKDLLLSLKRKAVTLVVPYLLWNTFYLTVTVLTRFANGTINQMEEWLPFILKAVFLYECNYALWYVFQLIILAAISPLLFYVYKNKYVSVIFSVGALFAYFFVNNSPIWVPLHGLGFYSVGAVAALHFSKSVDTFFWTSQKRKIVGFSALGVFVLICVLRMTVFDITQSIHEVRATPICRMMETGLAFSFWFAIDLINLGKKQVKPFEQCSFLLYVTHTFAIVVINFLLEAISLTMTPVVRLSVYLIGPMLITVAVVLASMILKKIFPRFYALISGGR